jgi:hypothetical protein
MTLPEHLKGRVPPGPLSKPRPNTPVWKGPIEDGVTFSLLNRYLGCKERFRLYVVEGLRPAEGFNHRLEFGNMWHLCEEFAEQKLAWEPALDEYCRQLMTRYKLAGTDILHWHGVCKALFPMYVKHWEDHPDVKDRRNLLAEQVFDVPYKLPSGRTIKLRGKWDGVDLIGKPPAAGVYLWENKTKGDINVQQIQRQLKYDLQTMLYLVALRTCQSNLCGKYNLGFPIKSQICGVRYNVVKRPRHYQGKKESREDFIARLGALVEASPGDFFMRWKVEVGPRDVELFRKQCLDPILENLCDDYEWWWDCKTQGGYTLGGKQYDHWSAEVRAGSYPGHSPRHFRFPFGVYNPLTEGNPSDLDEYLDTGNEIGLERTENLFPELTGGGK